MTIKEASLKSNVDINKLKYYEKKGLLEFRNEVCSSESGSENDEIEYIRSIHLLFEMGMEMEELRKLKEVGRNNLQAKKEQVIILRKYRFQLLEDIHGRQQNLDCLDYIIHKLKNKCMQ